MKINKFIYLYFVLILFLIFKSWFLPFSLSAGDWGYRFPETIREFASFPFGWDANFNNGVGGSIIFLLPLNTYSLATSAIPFNIFHIPWEIIEKLVWFIPFLIVSLSGAYVFFKRHFLKDNLLALVSSLIFTTNSYSLMIVGGGQIGVGMGYALIPWVAYGFLNILDNQNKLKSAIIAGVIFSLQIAFDLRIGYVTLVLIAVYYLLFILKNGFLKKLFKTFIPFSVIPGLVTVLIHFFWLFPFAVFRQNPLGSLGAAYTNDGIVKFLSFATFENTISLLHPNWPDNIFGKVYFMQPEFLVIPVLAFAVLLIIRNHQKKNKIIFFSLIALIGVFLAKGSNDPFGQFYVFLFQKFPGFVMFRDSTKWYGIIAISYSVLIPITLFEISELLKSNTEFSIFNFQFSNKFKNLNLKKALICVFILFWVLTIRQAVAGQVSGTFKTTKIPVEYQNLTHYMSNQKHFFRTLWVPNFTQFSFYSSTHPIIAAQDYYNLYSESALARKISNDEKQIEEENIKYIIIPSDIQGKIFLNDRKYSEKVYSSYVKGFEKIKWLKKVKNFGKIVVFEVNGVRDHFWSQNQNININYKNVNPVKYDVEVNNARKGDVLVFSEGFDPGWVARAKGYSVSSIQYSISKNQKLNSFVIPQDGFYKFDVYYSPQDLVNIGLFVSSISIFGIIILMFKLK